MRLLVFCTNSPYSLFDEVPTAGGAENSLRAAASTAAELGHSVWFLTTHRSASWLTTHGALDVSGVHVAWVRPFGPQGLRRALAGSYVRSLSKALSAAVSEFEPQVLMTYAPFPDTWLATQVRVSAARSYCIVERVSGRAWEAAADAAETRDRVTQAFSARDASLFVSSSLQAYTKEALAKRRMTLGGVEIVADLLEGGGMALGPRRQVDHARHYSGTRKRIVFAAAFKPGSKRQDLLVRALPLLLADGVDVECVFAGDGSTKQAMEALARENGVEKSCCFAGRMRKEDLCGLMTSADLAVLLSDFEGLPKAAMEPIAMGVPVLMSDRAWARDLLRGEPELEASCLCENSPEAVAITLRRLLTDESMALAVSNATQRVADSFAQRFDPREYVRQIEAIARDNQTGIVEASVDPRD